MIVESVLDKGRLVRATIQSTEIGVVFRKQQLGLHGVNLGINFKVVVWADGWR